MFGPTAVLVRDGGSLASTVGGADAEAFEGRGIRATNVSGQPDPAMFHRVLEMASEGELQVPITPPEASSDTFGSCPRCGRGARRPTPRSSRRTTSTSCEDAMANPI